MYFNLYISRTTCELHTELLASNTEPDNSLYIGRNM